LPHLFLEVLLMATDLKTVRQQLYSTPIDCRILALNNLLKLTHANTLNISDLMIDLHALRAKGIIDLKLANVVSGVSTFNVTPYAGPPLIPLPDEENTGENVGTGSLYGVVVASTAVTELWTVTFTTGSAYTVTGSFSGAQGTGSTAATFTATNLDISIPADVWSTGTHASGDIFYIPVYKQHSSIVLLSTMLATGLIFKGLASGAATQGGDTGVKFYDDAIALLDQMAASGGGLIGVNTMLNSSDMQVSYEVSVYGYDVSGYRADEFERYQSSSDFYSAPWWAAR
jgi:hypothetical protein